MSMSRFATHNAVLPKAGPLAYPQVLDFTTKSEILVDMGSEITLGHIDFISGVFVDNGLNVNDLEIEVGGIGQRVRIPAGKQAYMPLLIGDSPQLTFRTTANNQLHIPVAILNFPVWPYIW